MKLDHPTSARASWGIAGSRSLDVVEGGLGDLAGEREGPGLPGALEMFGQDALRTVLHPRPTGEEPSTSGGYRPPPLPRPPAREMRRVGRIRALSAE